MRFALAAVALVAAVAFAVTGRDHRTCQDARQAILSAVVAGRPATPADVEDVRARCRGTDGLAAAASALSRSDDRAQRAQALELAREAAEAEPENSVAWRAVAAAASGAEATSARRRVEALDPLPFRRSSGRSTR